MKLIIDIPDLLYYHEIEQDSHNNSTPIEKAIANGIPYEERPQGEFAKMLNERIEKVFVNIAQ